MHPSLRLLLLLMLAALVGSGCVGTKEGASRAGFRPEPPPRYRAEGLRLATLNTAFLFDGLDSEGQASFGHKGDPEAARVHRAAIGRILRMLDADVVMLQEVEHEEVLHMLVEEFLTGMDYRIYFVEGRDTFTGQDVALLARIPVDTVGRSEERMPLGTSGRDYGVSKHLFARLVLHGQPTTLIGVHLLAYPQDPNRKERREAQAEVIRRLVAHEAAAGRAVAVLGDFNDCDDAVLDRAGCRPITDVLARIKQAADGLADDLHNVLADVPRHDRYTSFWDRNRNDRVDAGELTAIDHILLAPALYRMVREVHYVQAHDPTTVTDHFPVVVTLAGE